MLAKRIFMGGPLDGTTRIENISQIVDTLSVPYLQTSPRVSVYNPEGDIDSHRPRDMYPPTEHTERFITSHIESFIYEHVDFGDDPLEIDEESHRLPTVLYADPALPLNEIIRRLLNSFERVGGLTAAFGISPSFYPQPFRTTPTMTGIRINSENQQ